MTEILENTMVTTSNNKMQIEAITDQNEGSDTTEVNSIVMGGNQQVYFRYAHTTPTAEGSPKQPPRSPRCEAFLMTGDKMLNLNPKISPCYAKICQNQLPPTVEIDSEEKQACKNSNFNQFPSMHKNGGIMATPNIKDKDSKGFDKGSMVTENFDDASGANIPADPSTDARKQQIASSEHQSNRTNKETDVARLLATQSHSTPTSPAHHVQLQGPPENRTDRQTQASNLSSSIDFAYGDENIRSSTYSPETIARLARHLFTHQEGIKIAAFLVKSDDLSVQIAREFASLFNFAGIRVDVALRIFLSHVHITGEAGNRPQLLSHFARRYNECNPTVFNSFDEIHALTCALLILNNDLHEKQNNKRMSCRDFIENFSHTDYSYNPAILKELYAAIKEQPFHYGSAQVNQTSSPTTRTNNKEKRMSRVLSMKGSASSSALINPEQQVDYKHGWLLKKSIYDADGKKTPIGRRKWQMQYATVRGMVLYLHQNEKSFSSGRYFTFRNCLLLHHCLAEIPRDYTKRKNVFRLRTANLGELLFQTSDPLEVQKWIDTINYVAAAFSTPALPTPVGSNGIVAFYKPHLPSMPTHLSILDQIRSHEQRLEETKENLSILRENAPSMKSKGKIVYDYFYKERFLDKEHKRYTIYVNILRDKMNSTSTASSKLNADSKSTNMLLTK